MKAAPCSCRVKTKRISGVSRSTSISGRFCVPGMPHIWSIPSRRKQSTSARAPETFAIAFTPAAASARRIPEPAPAWTGAQRLLQ